MGDHHIRIHLGQGRTKAEHQAGVEADGGAVAPGLLERPVDPAALIGSEADASAPVDVLPQIVPGQGSVVAPTAGTVELLVPVADDELSADGGPPWPP